jgi:hypothetical protein
MQQAASPSVHGSCCMVEAEVEHNNEQEVSPVSELADSFSNSGLHEIVHSSDHAVCLRMVPTNCGMYKMTCADCKVLFCFT